MWDNFLQLELRQNWCYQYNIQKLTFVFYSESHSRVYKSREGDHFSIKSTYGGFYF